jgi:hypothetical protein
MRFMHHKIEIAQLTLSDLKHKWIHLGLHFPGFHLL